MATTTNKQTFTREGLTAALHSKFERTTAEAEQRLRDLENTEVYEADLTDWRERSLEKVLDLYVKITGHTVTDDDLSKFTLKGRPEKPDKWDLRNARNEALEAKSRLARGLERLNSMKGDEFSLTPTMLRDWFAL